MTLGSEAARGGVAGGACACARVWTRYGTRAQSPWHCVTATLGQASAILDNRKHRLTDRALPPERTALSLVWYTWEQPWGTDHQPQELQGSCPTRSPQGSTTQGGATVASHWNLGIEESKATQTPEPCPHMPESTTDTEHGVNKGPPALLSEATRNQTQSFMKPGDLLT